MVVVSVTVRDGGLHPLQACKAWHLVEMEGYSVPAAAQMVKTVNGDEPKEHAMRNAISRVSAQATDDLPGRTLYANCGRKAIMTEEQTKAAVAFVQKWRHKRFCTCRYIIQELRLPVTKRTLARVLNKQGFYWKKVPRTMRLDRKDLEKRKAWVEQYELKSPAWWEQNMNLVLDGVTLTMAPKSLNARQKHAAQRIDHMWLRKGEKLLPDANTFNRYGVQLGTKVPLWGGFTGGGQFTLRLWTPHPKMKKADWEAHVPALKRAVDVAEARAPERASKRAKVWHDNEKFLLCPDTYRRSGLVQVRFPPNSGDLNPIETVWAWLRRDLAAREQEDLAAGHVLSVAKFRKRVAQLLNSYGTRAGGKSVSSLQKLVRGMPKRLANCRKNKFGRCGK